LAKDNVNAITEKLYVFSENQQYSLVSMNGMQLLERTFAC